MFLVYLIFYFKIYIIIYFLLLLTLRKKKTRVLLSIEFFCNIMLSWWDGEKKICVSRYWADKTWYKM